MFRNSWLRREIPISLWPPIRRAWSESGYFLSYATHSMSNRVMTKNVVRRFMYGIRNSSWFTIRRNGIIWFCTRGCWRFRWDWHVVKVSMLLEINMCIKRFFSLSKILKKHRFNHCNQFNIWIFRVLIDIRCKLML